MSKTKPALTAHKLNYPVNIREIKLCGPTVFYIDVAGNLVEAVLSDQQKKEVVEILQQTYEVQQ